MCSYEDGVNYIECKDCTVNLQYGATASGREWLVERWNARAMEVAK